MNFQNLNFDFVEEPRPYPQHVAESRLPRTPSNHSDSTLRPLVEDTRHDIDNVSSRTASPSPPTVVPYAPSSESPSNSTPELYGPDRHQLFGPPVTVPNPFYQPPRLQPLPRVAVENLTTHHAMAPSADLQGRLNADMLTGFRDSLVREAGVVTPGVDDTPYIQFAIESLTKDRDTGYSGNDSLSSGETLSGHRTVPDQGFGYYQAPATARENSATQKDAPRISGLPPAGNLQYGRLTEHTDTLETNLQGRPADGQSSMADFNFGFSPQARAAAWNNGSMLASKDVPSLTRRVESVPVDPDAMRGFQGEKSTSEYPELNYRPWLLRPASFLTLLLLCLLMTAALIFSAVYSSSKNGFTVFVNSSGQYFLFRVVPQLLAAIIVIYTQCITATLFRVLPFARLASDQTTERERSIYMDLFPRHTLWPQLIDEWEMWMFVFVSWLINITLPLQSSLFTPIRVDGIWKWGTVQGVAWTLVAMYVVLVVSTIVVLIEWMKITRTGLMWDPRSLADVIIMLSETNTVPQYSGTELASHRSTIGFALRHRNVERLGYWQRQGDGGIYYAIRSVESDDPRRSSGYTNDKSTAHNHHRSGGSSSAYTYDIEATSHQQAVRRGYLPWCLRSNQLIFSVVAATVLLVALFVVSFLPSTRITSLGFPPSVSSHPGSGCFSSADFLWSFLPSLLGLILYLLFQSVDMAFRVLQPWASLAAPSPSGASARQSILADYAACLPLQSSYRAARNGHYRVAVLSMLSNLFILLPVLGGGIFTALTDPTSHTVRMYPSTPVYGLVLALLVLYLVGLITCLPYRHDFRLPHGVTCLAEMIGFLVNDELLREKCFKGVRSRDEMLSKMGIGRSAADEGGRWMFGSQGVDGVLGVRRVARFTEKRRVRKSQIRRGGRYGNAGEGVVV